MKNKIWSTLALVLVCCSASCTEDDTFAVKPNYNSQSGYTPAEIASWRHAIFCFNDNRCTEIEMAADQAGLRTVETTGDRATSIAYESEENLQFLRTTAGANSMEYVLRIADINETIPAIWMQCASQSEILSGFSLKPLTSTVQVNFVNAPDSLKSVVLELPRMTDALYLASGKTEPMSESLTKTIDIQHSGESFNIFPMVRPSVSWQLKFTVKFLTETFTGSLTLQKGVQAGQQIAVNLDFTKLGAENTYQIAYHATTYGMQDEVRTVGEFFHVLPQDAKFQNKNPYYNVYILQDHRWKTVEVRSALCSDSPSHHEEFWNDWDNSKKLRDTMCYALFTDKFTEPVRVKVEKRSNFARVEVRPTDYAIMTKDSGSNMIEFTLPSYEHRKVSVEYDGDRYHNLFLMPSRPDAQKPTQSSANVIYYGAGEHTEGEIVLTEGQTLYVDEGATLYPQRIHIKGSNVTIAGRGVISGEKMRHWGEMYSNADVLIDVLGNGVTGGFVNFKIEGVTIIDAPSWCLRIFNTNQVTIENINMIHWDLNGDGIDLCTVTGATINDCMLRTYDDAITLKVRVNAKPYGDVHDVTITNCLVWCDYARGIVVGPECGNRWWNSGDIKNILIKDCIVLEAARGYALAIMQELGDFSGEGAAAKMDGITFENCIVDNIHQSGTPIYIYQAQTTESFEMNNVLFKNVTIRDSRGCQPSKMITNANYMGVTFDNLIYNQTKVTALGEHVTLSEPSDWQHAFYSFK